MDQLPGVVPMFAFKLDTAESTNNERWVIDVVRNGLCTFSTFSVRLGCEIIGLKPPSRTYSSLGALCPFTTRGRVPLPCSFRAVGPTCPCHVYRALSTRNDE